jgi:hypothetical protein
VCGTDGVVSTSCPAEQRGAESCLECPKRGTEWPYSIDKDMYWRCTRPSSLHLAELAGAQEQEAAGARAVRGAFGPPLRAAAAMSVAGDAADAIVAAAASGRLDGMMLMWSRQSVSDCTSALSAGSPAPAALPARTRGMHALLHHAAAAAVAARMWAPGLRAVHNPIAAPAFAPRLRHPARSLDVV